MFNKIFLYFLKRFIRTRDGRITVYRLLIGNIDNPNSMVKIAEELYESMRGKGVGVNWLVNVLCLSLKQLLAREE